ncbi:hypothetical protein POTOM_021469 [Populus tomentosa]|uniref:Uncharacterized protein n=1 Tax=Populus tomentosa TaxID=118781 RepID=A0A8X7ZRZ4_POPTO|nr:hypothetical protein POTOM_021469 [Populus tomentosa]
MTADLGCLRMVVDGSEGSMYAHDGPLITSSVDLLLLTPLNPLAPSSSPFSNHHLLSLLDLISMPSLSVPAFKAAIEAHQRKITEAILEHAWEICHEKKENVKTHGVMGDSKEKICEVVEHLHSDLLDAKIAEWYKLTFSIFGTVLGAFNRNPLMLLRLLLTNSFSCFRRNYAAVYCGCDEKEFQAVMLSFTLFCRVCE